MTYQKTRKAPEKFFTYQEVGAIAKATQGTDRRIGFRPALAIVHFADEPQISEDELNNFIDRCRKGVVQRTSFA